MTTIYPLDVRTNGSFAIPAKAYRDAKSLTGGTAESFTVPTDTASGQRATYAFFSATGDFVANYTTTAAAVADTSDGSAPDLNPTVRTLSGVETISVFAAADCDVVITYCI